MKRILTVLLAFALALMPSAALGMVPSMEMGCPKRADPCCDTPSRAACPTNSDDVPVDCCMTCSLVCCAYLPTKAAVLPLPDDVKFRWTLVAEKGDVRSDPPPLPPPRGA